MLKNFLNINKKRFWAGILLAQFFLFFLMSKSEVCIQFFNELFEQKKYAHQFLASKLPFSIGDVLYIILGIFLIYGIFSLFKKEKRSNTFKIILISLNAFYFIYQLCWGMLYFQAPLINKLSAEDINVEEAKKLSEELLIQCIFDRREVSENKDGVFYIEDINLLKTEILKRQKMLPKTLINKKNVSPDAMKPSLYRSVMSYTGILGYYNPFTAEAQYNSELPASYIPFTLAHESSHQLGYAREQEANFVGFLIGKDSFNADLRYSTNLFALKSLLRYIQSEDPKFVEQILENYSESMKRDAIAEKLFNEKHAGFLDKIFAITNNLFLKSNQQEGSITYSYFTELLIKYERKGT